MIRSANSARARLVDEEVVVVELDGVHAAVARPAARDVAAVRSADCASQRPSTMFTTAQKLQRNGQP